MNSVVKGMLVALLIVYIVSPLDLCPGPIDDVIIALCTIGGGVLSSKNKE